MNEPTSSWRWWLNLQVGLGLVGAGVWLSGAVLERDFVAGIGCGLLIGAVALRIGRSAARDTD
jgi:hypothetical protein